MTGGGDGMRQRALEFIALCVDAEKLEQMIRNARKQGEKEVERAAMRRLYEVKPEAQPGTLEHDVWRSIFALEGALTAERGKTVRLSRTRQKIKEVREAATVAALILKKAPSDGFHMLIERKWPELTFEALALRHPQRFDEAVRDAAERRLGSVLNRLARLVDH